MCISHSARGKKITGWQLNGPQQKAMVISSFSFFMCSSTVLYEDKMKRSEGKGELFWMHTEKTLLFWPDTHKLKITRKSEWTCLVCAFVCLLPMNSAAWLWLYYGHLCDLSSSRNMHLYKIPVWRQNFNSLHPVYIYFSLSFVFATSFICVPLSMFNNESSS